MDLNLLFAVIEQFAHSPAAYLVIIIISILIWAWEILPWADSRYIPVICVFLGPAITPWFVSRGSVSPDYPYPLAVILAQGLIFGLISFTVHAQVVKRFLVPVPKTSTTPVNP